MTMWGFGSVHASSFSNSLSLSVCRFVFSLFVLFCLLCCFILALFILLVFRPCVLVCPPHAECVCVRDIAVRVCAYSLCQVSEYVF